MKLVVPGGSGKIGVALVEQLRATGHAVTVLSRKGSGPGPVRQWDGNTLGSWAEEIDGCDAVINLAGRSVNCRYTRANLAQMMDSRVASTRAVGLAIARAKHPPRVWLQMSTATIYAHRFDAPNDETSGRLGGDEPALPHRWHASIAIAKAWERTLLEADTPHTRKVALRTAMVMSPDRGGTFDLLLRLTRFGLGGAIAGGRQYMSWIHAQDLLRAVEFLLAEDSLQGPVNLAAPHPLPQAGFMAELRRAWGRRLGIPASGFSLAIAAFFHRTEPELILKSRRVVPQRLLQAGFRFDFPEWGPAARDLVARWRAGPSSGATHAPERPGTDPAGPSLAHGGTS